MRPLEKAAALAWWQANISGKDEDFKVKEEAQNRLDAALADPARFAELKAAREGLKGAPAAERGGPEQLGRQVDVLYLQYLEKQVDPELLKRMTALANAVEKKFNVYRARVGEKELTRQRQGGTGRRLADAPRLLAGRPDLLKRLGLVAP